jgi:SpoVK/Ycf46/Vps4 family AAA+-type ATPase
MKSEDIKRTLQEIIATTRYDAALSQEPATGGYGARSTVVLFEGRGGTGKTLAAEVLAKEIGKDLSRVDLKQVAGRFIGETEKNLDRIFDAAAARGSVLFFDEADALFGKRSEVKDVHDRFANIEISYLLQRLDEHPGVAVLAVNDKRNLDDAFHRRIRFTIDFPRPGVK